MMTVSKGTTVFAIIEVMDGRPLILACHLRPDCPRLLHEATDAEADQFRAIVRHPDRIADLLQGSFQPLPGTKSLMTLCATDAENEFVDADGSVHIIAKCQECCRDRSH